MGGVGITYNDVKEAITTLQGQQKNPTVDNVRNALGTGSRTTIAKYLRQWKSKNHITSADEAGVPNELLQLVRGLWEKLHDDADQEILKYKSEADSNVNEAQQAFLKKQNAYTLLQREFHDLEEKSHHQKSNIKSLELKLSDQKNENSKYIERIDALTNINDENKAENARLHQLLKNTQENLSHYQNAVQEQRQEQALLVEKQRNEYEQKISGASRKIDQLKSELIELKSQNKQMARTHENLESEQQALQLKYNTLSTSHESLSQSHGKLKSSYDTLLTHYEKLKQATESKTNEIIDLKILLKSQENKNNDIEKSLSKTDGKIQQLRHELDIVKQEKSYIEGQLKLLQEKI